jgi:hypothetical protein
MVVVRPSADPEPVGAIAELDPVEHFAVHKLLYGPEDRRTADSAMGGPKTLPEVVCGKQFAGTRKLDELFDQ